MIIMSNYHTKICTKCNRVFSKESSNLETCFPCSESIRMQAKRVPNRICSSCNEGFYSPNDTKKCVPCCSKGYSTLSKSVPVIDNSKEKAKRKPVKPIPYEVLNKKCEKKRVYDNDFASHFVRWGGLSDRI